MLTIEWYLESLTHLLLDGKVPLHNSNDFRIPRSTTTRNKSNGNGPFASYRNSPLRCDAPRRNVHLGDWVYNSYSHVSKTSSLDNKASHPAKTSSPIAMATTYYSQPAAANYYGPASAHHPSQKQRGYRLCDQCGAAENPATSRFRMCGGCVRF